MHGECYFCHGLVSSAEADHILLTAHGDHEVFMHRRCAAGHNVVEEAVGEGRAVAVTCPECGAVETHEH